MGSTKFRLLNFECQKCIYTSRQVLNNFGADGRNMTSTQRDSQKERTIINFDLVLKYASARILELQPNPLVIKHTQSGGKNTSANLSSRWSLYKLRSHHAFHMLHTRFTDFALLLGIYAELSSAIPDVWGRYLTALLEGLVEDVWCSWVRFISLIIVVILFF